MKIKRPFYTIILTDARNRLIYHVSTRCTFTYDLKAVLDTLDEFGDQYKTCHLKVDFGR